MNVKLLRGVKECLNRIISKTHLAFVTANTLHDNF
jgi:hypothetical protein